MKNSVNDFANIGELLKDYTFKEEADIPEEHSEECLEEPTEEKVYKTMPTSSLVTVMAYMMGLDLDRLRMYYGEYNSDLIDKLCEQQEPTIIRYLSRLRTTMMMNFKNVDDEMRFNLGNIDRIDCFHQDEIKKLRSWGIEVIRTNFRADKYNELFCELIQQRIDGCKSIFPEWVNFDYIRDVFIVPKYIKTEVMKAEYNKYRANINYYPFQMYIHWEPGDHGNILISDGKFLQLIYSQHGDVFRDRSKFHDAVEDTKKSIYDYIDYSARVMIVVDCENSDVYKLHGVLKNLDADEIAKIEKIVLYDDSHTSDGWDWLEKFVKIPVEHVEVERVTDHKSLVDVVMTAGICQAFYRDNINSFILCSSDSDFWGVISTIPDARFLVLYEYSKCGQSIKDALTLNNIYHCSMDDFYTGNADEIRRVVLRKALEREIQDINGKNGLEIARKIFADNHIDATEKEIEKFYEKYVKTIKLKMDSKGNFYFDITQ